MRTLGIDIGGSKIEYIVLDFKPFRIIDRQRYKTPRTRKRVLELLDSILRLAIEEYKVDRAGMGIPGYIINRRIYNSPNTPFFEGYKIYNWIEKQDIGIVVENDANLFAYAESLLGAGKGYNPVIGVIWGTGIGAGIIINREIYKGFYGSAGEFGHTIIKPNGRKCNCGKHGCLEAYAGGGAIVKRFHSLGGSKKVSSVEALVKTNSKIARRVLNEAINYMAIGIANLVNIISPEIVVLGGGLSNIPNIDKKLLEKASKHLVRGISIEIRRNMLGDSAGVIGAALIAKKA